MVKSIIISTTKGQNIVSPHQLICKSLTLIHFNNMYI